MWTLKRVVLLALGFFVFFSGYMLYASCLGGIDGLPPLPLVDYPSEGPNPVGPSQPPGPYKLEDKLRQAFGQDCPELKWPLKLEMNSGNMVVAAYNFTIQDDDGRLKIDQLSIALFRKDKDSGDGRGVEINTVRAREAYLTFDKKLGKSEKDFTGRRIVAAELHGAGKDDPIEIVNNHRTPQRDDDLHVTIDNGPLYYDEAKSLIWSDDKVQIEDDQNQPPDTVDGLGVEIHLLSEARPDGKPTPRAKAKETSFTGVDRLALKRDVHMHLHVASGGFLADSAAPATKAAAPGAAPEKANLLIATPGRFEYEFRKDGDLARFDVPSDDPAARVSVCRLPPPPDPKLNPPMDQLRCRRLELRLRSNGAAAPGDGHSPGHNLQVESAHATAAAPSEVVLTSETQKVAADGNDTQKLTAHGNDFEYNARTHLTILKGDPAKPDSQMWADQDGNLIHAHELQIMEQQGPNGTSWRQVTANGAGRIDFKDAGDNADKKTDKKPDKRTLHAAWRDKLLSTKDGVQDLVVLSGGASFVDDEHDQNLQAETLKVWLIAPQPGAPAVGAPPTSQAAPTQSRRPSRVEAIGNVVARSRDMNIVPPTGQLVVFFRDVPTSALPTSPSPSRQGDEAKRGQADKAAAPAVVADRPSSLLPVAPAGPLPATPTATADPEPARPVELDARSIYAWVDRAGDRTALQKLRAEGEVKVHQDPAKGDERGVDIVGDALEMTCHPDGNTLVVQGDVAQLYLNKLTIYGPEVTIDQASNTAQVYGAGLMEMESKSNFQGEPLAKPVPLTVTWIKEMFFNGRYAGFDEGVLPKKEDEQVGPKREDAHVGVQAEQDNAHLACESLQVFFDHYISLKEGNRGGPPPRVMKMVCHKDVRVEDHMLEDDKVVRYQALASRELEMNSIEPDDVGAKPGAASDGNEVRAPGPGQLRLFQRGGQDPLAPPPAPGAKVTAAKPGSNGKPTADEPTKLTYITYGDPAGGGSMYVNSKTNKATFLGRVRVLNMPCDNPYIEIDLDEIVTRMPLGAMYVQSDRLTVRDQGDKKKSQQEMHAEGHVLAQAREYMARCDVLDYNEAKDQIIFKGGDGGLATLYKRKQAGGEVQTITGKEIRYIRSTGKFQIEGGEWLSGN
jgi:hypothetical protein